MNTLKTHKRASIIVGDKSILAEEGAVAFFNQEKAFDMVSFTTINAIFAKQHGSY
jgi:hypothetical protein